MCEHADGRILEAACPIPGGNEAVYQLSMPDLRALWWHCAKIQQTMIGWLANFARNHYQVPVELVELSEVTWTFRPCAVCDREMTA